MQTWKQVSSLNWLRFFELPERIPLSRPRLILTGKADLAELQLPDADLLRGYLQGEQQSRLGDLIGTDAWAESNAAGHVSEFICQELNDLRAAQDVEGAGILLAVVGPDLPKIAESFRTGLADDLADRLATSDVLESLAKVLPEAVNPNHRKTATCPGVVRCLRFHS